jgi:hypothetical protein
MNLAPRIFALAAFAVVLSACGSLSDARTSRQYGANLEGMEKWISGSVSFAAFDKEMEMNQAPTQYRTQIKKLDLPPSADLAAMGSIERKNDHIVLIQGAARTKSGEVVGFWITIDESIQSK